MARRRKQSPFEDLIDIAALLPWWVSLPLALISYLSLHSIATTPIPTLANPAELGSQLPGMMFRGLAAPAQRGSLEETRGKGFAVFHPTFRQRRCIGGVGG